MSFVQSAFFLQLTLMALSLEVDAQTRAEIDRAIGFRESDKVHIVFELFNYYLYKIEQNGPPI